MHGLRSAVVQVSIHFVRGRHELKERGEQVLRVDLLIVILLKHCKEVVHTGMCIGKDVSSFKIICVRVKLPAMKKLLKACICCQL